MAEIWPESLYINAWSGEGDAMPAAPLQPDASSWMLQNVPLRLPTFLAPPEKADETKWSDPRIGWTLVLAKSDKTLGEMSDLADVPDSLRQLWIDRGKPPALRYDPKSANVSRLLFDYKNNRTVTMEKGTPMGTAPGALPRYLLIYGTPEEVPWDVQYRLNPIRAVGRLPFDRSSAGEAALNNYVARLRQDWKGSSADFTHTLVWATDRPNDPMAALMRAEVAEKLQARYAGDSDLKSIFLAAADATLANLNGNLASHHPGLIVTTSHGQTGPVAKPDVMRAKLGMLVDQESKAIGPSDLDGGVVPDGAIWYAHACCSAGCASMSDFENLINPETAIGATLKALTTLGSLTAPLPLALLGATNPLRAFVGHIEPTFNFSLRQPATQDSLTSSLEAALYTNIYQKKREPIGYAFRDCHERVGGLFNSMNLSLKDLRARRVTLETEGPAMLWALLAAFDLRSIVILGDPTVIVPKG